MRSKINITGRDWHSRTLEEQGCCGEIVNTDKKKKAKIFIKKGVSIKEWKRIRWDSGPISA